MELFEEIYNGTLKEAKTVESTRVELKQEGNTEVLKDDQKTIGKKIFQKNPVYLSIKYASTINLGNYQTARIEKGLFIAVGDEISPEVKHAIQKTDESVSKLLEQLVQKEIDEINVLLEERKGRGGF